MRQLFIVNPRFVIDMGALHGYHKPQYVIDILRQKMRSRQQLSTRLSNSRVDTTV